LSRSTANSAAVQEYLLEEGIYTVNRIKLGDECTKFFHAMATITFWKNAITQLKDDTGLEVFDHEGKVAYTGTAWF
jgi:hypothetical protein